MPGFKGLRTDWNTAAPLLLAAAAVFALALSPTWDYDVWFQLACGKAIGSLHGLPANDLFSYTASQRPWDSQEWLAQVIFYGVFSLGSITALALLKSLGAALLVLPLFRRAAERMADPWLTGAVLVWAAYVMRWALVERPHLFTMLFLALELLLLARRRGIILLIPLAALWANIHGGASLLAPMVLGVWIACEYAGLKRKGTGMGSLRIPLMVLLGVSLALLLNPSGWRLFTYAFETMTDRMYMANVREWIPPALDEQPAFFLFLALAVLLLGASVTQFGLFDMAIALLFAAMALSARRHVPLFVIAAAPLVARALTLHTWGAFSRLRFPLRPMLAVPVILAFPAVLFLRGEALRTGVRQDLYPAGAAEDLAIASDSFRGSPPVRIYNIHKWGGYLAWHLPDKFKVFIDGRQLVYGRRLFLDYYLTLEDTPEAGALIRKYRPDLYVLDYGTKLGRRLAKDHNFALVYWDDTCLVYAARGPRTALYIKEREYSAYNPETGLTGPFERAVKEIVRAAARAPDAARPFTGLSALLLEKGRPREAFEAADKALARKPNALPVVLAATQASLALGDIKTTSELVRRARKIDPRAAETRLAQARLALVRGETRKADDFIAAAIAAGERRMRKFKEPRMSLADAYRLKAFRFLQERNGTEAAEALRRAGNAAYDLGRTEWALLAYREAAALAPSDMRIHHNMGAVLLNRGEFVAAEKALKQALALAPDSVESLAALGVVYARTGREAEARRTFEKALEIRPGDAAIRGCLADLDRPQE